ncbi:MAG: acyltransferase [Firmicutes bacterium]|nr:acyltransferase [Bacillota bacterium]MCM1400480.1 acyltransferase [Bacteroides sp.]MCM1477451.1 acyltransferase [Bacteroides sp.]
MKVLLLLGVVLIHCNLSSDFSASTMQSNCGLQLVNYLSKWLMRVCVPIFYIISGFLFFNGLNKFSFSTYSEKLRRRVHTLLVPYILWCCFCGVILILKSKYMGFPGLGVVEDDGHINFLGALQSFWVVPGNPPYPFAFAFWFIRNLMVFTLLAPAVWCIARQWWSYALFMAVYVALDENLYGLEWFITGAAVSLLKIALPQRVELWIVLTAAMAWIGAALLLSKLENHIAVHLTMCAAVAAATVVFYFASVRFALFFSTRIGSLLVANAFFIYAFHQCFCSMARQLWEKVVGIDTCANVMLTYMLTFVTLAGVSTIVGTLVKKASPRFFALITGGR